MDKATKKSAATYKHTPLPDAAAYIRLLELSETTTGDETGIRCNLTTWSIDEAPKYHAVSYTWGDADQNETIFVDGVQYMVRKNCADVLRQLLHFKTSLYYWIDALCINQDDIEEKNHQVARMSDVFENAEHELACIGQDNADDAEFAMLMIERLEEHCEHFDSPYPWSFSEEIPEMHFKHIATLSSMLGEDLKRFTLSLKALTSRPYFYRVWVVQELLLGQEVSICCGFHRQPLTTVEFYVRQIVQADVVLMYRVTGLDSPIDHEYPQALLDAVRVWKAKDRFGGMGYQLLNKACDRVKTVPVSHQRRRWSLAHILGFGMNRQCANVRDVVYGMLALIDWDGQTPIQPDYNKSPYDLCVEILHYFTNPYGAWTMITNLRLDSCDTNVQSGMALRNIWTQRPFEYAEAMHGPSTNGMVTAARYGRQIIRSESLLFGSEARQGRYCRVVLSRDSQAREPIAIVAPIVKLGDWIVRAIYWHKPRGFVLRQIGTRFAIIGQAIIMEFRADQKSDTPFDLFFDPDDFVVWAANSLDEESDGGAMEFTLSDLALERLNIGICKGPFSSFAKLNEPEELHME